MLPLAVMQRVARVRQRQLSAELPFRMLYSTLPTYCEMDLGDIMLIYTKA